MGNNGERESEWSRTQCYITITSKSIKYVIDRSWCENASKSVRTLERRIKIEKQTVKVCAKNSRLRSSGSFCLCQPHRHSAVLLLRQQELAFIYYNRWELSDEIWSPSQHTGRRMWVEGAGGCHPGCGTALPTPSASSSTMAKTVEQAKRLRRWHSLWTLQLSVQPFVSDLRALYICLPAHSCNVICFYQ